MAKGNRGGRRGGSSSPINASLVGGANGYNINDMIATYNGGVGAQLLAKGRRRDGGSAGNKDAGDIQASGSHQHTGDNLIAACQQNQAIQLVSTGLNFNSIGDIVTRG